MLNNTFTWRRNFFWIGTKSIIIKYIDNLLINMLNLDHTNNGKHFISQNIQPFIMYILRHYGVSLIVARSIS